eukprot:gene552-299_t
MSEVRLLQHLGAAQSRLQQRLYGGMFDYSFDLITYDLAFGCCSTYYLASLSLGLWEHAFEGSDSHRGLQAERPHFTAPVCQQFLNNILGACLPHPLVAAGGGCVWPRSRYVRTNYYGS